MYRFSAIAFAALFGLCLLAPRANATVLPVDGSSVTPSPGTVAGLTQLATVTDSGSDVSGSHRLDVSVQSWVYQDPITKFLTFAWQINNLATSNTFVERFTAAEFPTSLFYDASYNKTGSQVAPLTANQGDGQIGWNFPTGPGKLAAGMSSALLILSTHFTTYESGLVGTHDTNVAVDDLNSFQPTPEPSSMAIAGLGALGLIGYGIRRRRGA